MNPWKGLNLLPRKMWIVFWVTLINRTGTMVLPFLALYLTKGKHVTESDAGLVIGVYGFAALITAPFIGRLADKIGALSVMKLSLVSSGIMFFIYSTIESYTGILIVTFFQSVLNESFRPASLSLVSEIVQPKQRRTAFALNRLAINLGMSIGPVAGGLLSEINFSLLFYVDGATALLAGFYLLFIKWDNQSPEVINTDTSQPVDKDIHPGILKDSKYIYFLLAIIPVEMVFFQHIGALPLFIVNGLGYSNSIFGLFSAINTILIILIEVPLNNIMSGWSFRSALSLGAILCGIGFGIPAFTEDLVLIIISIIVWTFGEMIFFPGCAAYAAEISPIKKRGEYMGFFQMTFSFAFTAGPWLGTVALENFGPFWLWNGTLFLGALTALLMLGIKEGEIKISS